MGGRPQTVCVPEGVSEASVNKNDKVFVLFGGLVFLLCCCCCCVSSSLRVPEGVPQVRARSTP